LAKRFEDRRLAAVAACGESETIALLRSTARRLSATTRLDDHADDRFDISIRARMCPHVVLVVSLRLAI
jgi:hypothetical protein